MTSLKQILEAGPRRIQDGDWARVKETVSRHPETLQDKELAKKVMSITIHKDEFGTVKDIVADPRAGITEFNLFKNIASVRGRNKILKFLERVSAVTDAVRDGDEAKAEEIVANYDGDLDHSGTHADSHESYDLCTILQSND